MTKKEFKILKHKLLTDKSITGISYNPLTIEPNPKIELHYNIQKSRKNDSRH